MVEKTRVTMSALPGQILFDAGYCSNKNLEYAKTVEADTGGKTEFFIATGRVKHGDREHFVFSSNVDALFTRNGFDSDRVYTPQGDYSLHQCRTPCTREVWDARPILEKALSTYDPEMGAVAEDAVPSCPNCGGPVYLNVFAGSWHINDHLQPQIEAANAWLQHVQQQGLNLVIVEIGSGFNTPGVIRWPLETIARGMPNNHHTHVSAHGSSRIRKPQMKTTNTPSLGPERLSG